MDPQQRIAELEAELAAAHARIVEQDARIAEQDARIAEQDARIAEQDARILALTKQGEVLLEKLGQNSRNSHKPPRVTHPA